MRNLTYTALVALLYNIVLNNQAQAQFQVNAMGSYIGPVERYASYGDGSWGGGAALKYFTNSHMAVGLNGRYFTNTRSRDYGSYSGNDRITAIALTGQVECFLTETVLQPYVGIEAGLYISKFNSELSGSLNQTVSFSNTYFGLAPKIGVQYSITPIVGLNIEGGYHIIFDGNDPSNSLLLSGGVFLKLGPQR